MKSSLAIIVVLLFASMFTSQAIAQWLEQPSGIITPLFMVKAVSQSVAWAEGLFGTVLRTTNGGTTWTSASGGAFGSDYISGIEAPNRDTAFVAYNPGGGTTTHIYRTTNGGASWNSAYVQNPGFINVIHMTNANNGIAVGDPAGGKWTVLKTSDGGATWARIATEPPQIGTETGSNVNGMYVIGTSFVWFTSRAGRVYRSTDGGATWNYSALPFAGWLPQMQFNDVQYGLVGNFSGTDVARTSDGGVSWASITLPNSDQVRGITGSGLDFFVNKGQQVFRSTDRGASYSVSYPGGIGGNLTGSSSVVNGNDIRIWAVTNGGGILRYDGTLGTSPLSPTAIDFGNVAVGRSSDSVAVTVRNQSSQPLIINSITRSHIVYSLLTLPALPVTLAPSDSIGFRLCFRPTNRGAAYGMVTMTYNDTLTATVSLQGNGLLFGSQFATFVDRVTAAPYPNRTAIVDSFLSAHPNMPFSEQDSICQFIYRGNAASVNVPGDANEWNVSGFPMVRLSSTDLWYRSEVFEPDARLEYKFVLDGSNWILDPRNPYQVVGGFGPNSELRMPSYVPAPEIQYYPNIPHGTLQDTTFFSTNLSNSRTIRVYLPSGYSPADSFPVVLFHDGIEYVTLAQANNALDYLISQNRIRPTIGVFVPPVNRDEEYVGSLQNQYAAFISTELMPYIDTRYRTQRRPTCRATVGISNGGNIALWIAYSYPQVFGNAGSYSGNIQPATSSAFQNGPPMPLKLYVDAGTYDLAGFILLSRNFRQSIQTRGYVFRYNEWHEGHSWGNWRAHLDNALEFFVPGSAVDVVEHETIPAAFEMMQNYPNPFNPSTRIGFRVPGSGFVSLKVYDVLGREVKTLVNEELKPGSYETTFDASGLSSGVYFYRLETKSFVSTKNLLLLR